MSRNWGVGSAGRQTPEVPSLALSGMDKVLTSCFLQVLQAMSHCSLWAAESPLLGKCHYTTPFHSPPESLQLSVRYWSCLGLFLQTLALPFVQKSAGVAGRPAHSEPTRAACELAVGNC